MKVGPLKTSRLILRPFKDTDRDAFAALNANPVVMDDLGGPLSKDQSDTKLAHYRSAYEKTGFSRCVIELPDATFLGYAGIMLRDMQALGKHYDLGWRLNRSAWGKGYATEAACAILEHTLFEREVPEILAYTGPDNDRSQKVMERLGLLRRPELDFSMKLDTKDTPWKGLVWSASRTQWRNPGP
ncbi:MAG: GNAT family N-acetyltransferase [Rhodobacteraceae bacterium]|nr:GNAT family N-acetyltransferase [Paracoccaceae bacterium]